MEYGVGGERKNDTREGAREHGPDTPPGILGHGWLLSVALCDLRSEFLFCMVRSKQFALIRRW
jgi:hypothetical protein